MRTWFLLVTFLSIIFTRAYAAQPPGVVIDHQDASTGEYIGSPSIVISPNGNYIATHDLFGPQSSSTTSAETRVFVSKDRGLTWTKTAVLQDQFWSNLFIFRGNVYLMGTTAEYGRIVIRNSDDNGNTWSKAHYLTQDSGYHTAPVPIAIHNRRIYRAFEYHPAGPWGSFQAFMMSAPIESDLLLPASWSFSNRLRFPVGNDGDAWLEGNAVVAPDKSIVDILRVNNLQHAAILKLCDSTLALDRFVDFQGGATKFTIRFDPLSKLYWALTNPALPGEALSVSSPGSVRNTLAVMSSRDLIHWTPRAIVFHHADPASYAFQYVDWQIQGTDLILVSRTAFDDNAAGAHSYHDANFLTFYRVHNFRRLGIIGLTGHSFTVGETVSHAQIERWTASTALDATKAQQGVYSQAVGRYATHTTTLTTRAITGGAEQHSDWSDIFFVVKGEATMVSGGVLEKAHLTSPGEMRGSSIAGGTSQSLEPGSIVHISRMVPHQLLITPGTPFTYFVVKIKGP